LTAEREREDGVSVRTANAYVQAVKQFTRWAVRVGLLAEDPLVGLGTLGNPEKDRRLERRALTRDELAKLIATTTGSDSRDGMSGDERALLYLVACSTGLRRKELMTLRIADLDLANIEDAAIVVRASNAKNGRAARLPLNSAIAAGLARMTDGAAVTARVFHIPKHWRAADMLRADLTAAEIDATDAQGRRVDFHALRTTFGTNLARNGVSLPMAQKLMRHSDPRLTANVYTVLSDEDARQAIAALPSPETVVFGSDFGSTAHQQGDALGRQGTDLASELASPAGLEPATYGLGNRRSIRLSYGDAVWTAQRREAWRSWRVLGCPRLRAGEHRRADGGGGRRR